MFPKAFEYFYNCKLLLFLVFSLIESFNLAILL